MAMLNNQMVVCSSHLRYHHNPWRSPFNNPHEITIAFFGRLSCAADSAATQGLPSRTKDRRLRRVATSMAFQCQFPCNVNPGLINHGLLIRGVLLQ